MATTNFVDGLTVVVADWLNDVDAHAYDQDTTSHEASHISVIPSGNLVATEVQAALVELQGDVDTRALTAGQTFTGAVSVPSGASGAQVPQAQEVALLATTQLGSHRNRLINGSFSENVRALTTIADDTYCLDRWYILTETGNVTIAQVTDPEVGAPFGIRLTQPDASPKRMGIAQIIESKNIRQFASAVMNLSARAKLSIAGNIRYAVIEHTGTADTVTSDVVNNWASTTYTPSNFFIAGVNIIDTGVVAPGAGIWGTLSDSGALGASVKNVIVFLWTEAQVAQNVTLEINRVQYERGTSATLHEWRLDESQLCRRYAEGGTAGLDSYHTAGQTITYRIQFSTQKRAAPAMTGTFSYFNASGGFLDNSTVNNFRCGAVVTATGAGAFSVPWLATSEL